MSFAISTNHVGVITLNNKSFAIAQPEVSQAASLYSIDISSQNDFASDPNLDIIVFNNPKAVEYYLSDVMHINDFTFERPLKTNSNIECDKDHLGRYIVAAKRGDYITPHIPYAPVTFSPIHEHGTPFWTETKPSGNFSRGYISILIVCNNLPADTNDLIVKTTFLYQ